jgi:hypothetical protein
MVMNFWLERCTKKKIDENWKSPDRLPKAYSIANIHTYNLYIGSEKFEVRKVVLGRFFREIDPNHPFSDVASMRIRISAFFHP